MQTIKSQGHLTWIAVGHSDLAVRDYVGIYAKHQEYVRIFRCSETTIHDCPLLSWIERVTRHEHDVQVGVEGCAAFAKRCPMLTAVNLQAVRCKVRSNYGYQFREAYYFSSSSAKQTENRATARINAERSMQFVRLALIRSFFGAEVADGLIRDGSAAKERIRPC